MKDVPGPIEMSTPSPARPKRVRPIITLRQVVWLLVAISLIWFAMNFFSLGKADRFLDSIDPGSGAAAK